MKRITLRRRNGAVAYALVDDSDFDWLNQWRWCLYVNNYPGRTGGILMHRFILGLGYGDPRQGDHINRNTLDNRRANLRIAVNGGADNVQNKSLRVNNKSGYRGVSWDAQECRWRAQAQHKGKKLSLGRFGTAKEADAAAKAFRAIHMPFSEDARSTDAQV